jgi:homopolymeric O-antigen transport system permease protein
MEQQESACLAAEEAVSAPSPSSSGASPAAVTNQPWLIIEARRGWAPLDWRGLWSHRDLLLLLAWRDIKVRYQQTLLGAAWAILQPLLATIMFTLLFGKLARIPSEGEPYSIFVLAGLLPWNLFNSAVAASSSSLVGNSNLITKVYFPRLIIPSAALGAPLLDFLIATLMLFALMPFYSLGFSPRLLMLPLLLLLTVLVSLGAGLLSAALNVKYRDVRHALPFLLQLWMYATPIIYPLGLAPARWRWIFELNPLSGIVEGMRDAVFDRSFDWTAMGFSIVLGAALLMLGAQVFQRMEAEFADVI